MRIFKAIALTLIALNLTACGVRSIPKAKLNVEEKAAEITNQYKRRSDLVPALVKVVKGYATHEKEVLTRVTEARAKVSQMNLDVSQLDPQKLKEFQAAQGQLSQALGRLLVSVERYPDLKANQNFRDLQAQLEGTENRIAIARQRYIESIKLFNEQILVFPTNLTNKVFFHYEKMPQWEVDAAEQVEKMPEVDL